MRFFDKLRTFWGRKDNEVRDGIRFGQGRRFFIYDAALSASISVIAGGAFIAGLVAALGGTDETNGLIGAFAVMVAPVQIIAAYFFEGMKTQKPAVLISAFISKFLSAFLFFIPLLFRNSSWGLIVFIVTFFLVNASASFCGPGSFNWTVNLVPENIRSKFFARRESVVMAVVAVLTLITGFGLDVFNAHVGLLIGFAILGVVLLVLTIVNLIFVAKIDEPPVEKLHAKTSLADVFRLPLKHKSFVKIVALGSLWNLGLMFGLPFMAVYMVSQLEVRYTYIVLLNLLSLCLRAVLAPFFGRLCDKKGYRFVVAVSASVITLSTLMWVFVNHSTVWPLLPITFIVGAVGWAGFSVSMINLQVGSMPAEIRTSCISVNSAITGFVGFISALIASRFLAGLGAAEIAAGGFIFSPMQIVFFVSMVLQIICLMYLLVFTQVKNSA